MTQVISWCNQKGGVGKTTCCVNTAGILSQKGYKVLVVDIDPQGNASVTILGENVKTYKKEQTIYSVFAKLNVPFNNIRYKTRVGNLDIVPSSLALTELEITLITSVDWGRFLTNFIRKNTDEYDFVFIDCPPNLGVYTINALVASGWHLIPIQTERYAFSGHSDLTEKIATLMEFQPNLKFLGAVATMYDARTRDAKEWLDQIKATFGNQLLATIHRSAIISNASSSDRLLHEITTKDRPYREYLALAKSICRLTLGAENADEKMGTVATDDDRGDNDDVAENAG